MKKYIPHLLTFVFLLNFSFYTVHAQGGAINNGPTSAAGNGPTVSASIDNPLAGVGVDSIQALLKVILNNIVIPIGGIVAVLAFIYSGFLYVMAQGDETKIKTAHRTLLYTAIGTAVLLGATVIADVLTATVQQLK